MTFPASWNVIRLDSCPLELNTISKMFQLTTVAERLSESPSALTHSPPRKVMDGVVTLIADDGKHQISVPLQIPLAAARVISFWFITRMGSHGIECSALFKP